MNKKALTETDIRSKFITPALCGPQGAGWDLMTQIREEAQIEAKTVGVALTHFNTQSVAQMTVTLPPLNEQHRIVVKVDQLMALVEQLETQLAASRTTAKNLLEALVAELT